MFGGKYVSLTSPKHPQRQRITSADVIDARSVTTEINTLFQTLTSIAEKVDPVKLNLTLSGGRGRLGGVGRQVRAVDGQRQRHPGRPQPADATRSATTFSSWPGLGDVYADASPDLLDFLGNAVTTAHTLNKQQDDLDAALLAAVGFGNTGADIFERGGPLSGAGAADLVPDRRAARHLQPRTVLHHPQLHDDQDATPAPTVARTDRTGSGNGY